jgi:hypothetical protein
MSTISCPPSQDEPPYPEATGTLDCAPLLRLIHALPDHTLSEPQMPRYGAGPRPSGNQHHTTYFVLAVLARSAGTCIFWPPPPGPQRAEKHGQREVVLFRHGRVGHPGQGLLNLDDWPLGDKRVFPIRFYIGQRDLSQRALVSR